MIVLTSAAFPSGRARRRSSGTSDNVANESLEWVRSTVRHVWGSEKDSKPALPQAEDSAVQVARKRWPSAAAMPSNSGGRVERLLGQHATSGAIKKVTTGGSHFHLANLLRSTSADSFNLGSLCTSVDFAGARRSPSIAIVIGLRAEGASAYPTQELSS